MRIINQRDGMVVASDVEVARSLRARMIGLIGRRTLMEGSALVIPKCKQVHTFLMRFPIDVVFTDHDGRVVCIAGNVIPGRVTGYCRSAYSAIELPAGAVQGCGIRVGDMLRVEGANE